jgi:hypothetical protein
VGHFFYQLGTFWIYKDSLTGRVDSFVVTSTDTDSLYIYKGYKFSDPYDYSYIKINVVEWEISPKSDSFVDNWVWQLLGNMVYLNIIQWLNYDDRFIVYPLDSGQVINGNESTGMVTKVLSNLVAAGTSFSNVALLNQSESYGGGYDDWFYISSDVGIVKMKIDNTPQEILVPILFTTFGNCNAIRSFDKLFIFCTRIHK